MSVASLANWTPRERPSAKTFQGKYVRLEKLDADRHGADLFDVLQGPSADPWQWDYLLAGPFPERDRFNEYLKGMEAGEDPFVFTVINQANGKAEGMLSFCEIAPETGSIEIGFVVFGAAMQRSPKGTEANYLLMKEAFDLGYRRLEWTCHTANERSRNAAVRYGYSFEGTLRQRFVHKGRYSRDDFYLGIMDYEWPEIKRAFEKWLSDANTTPSGQVRRLQELIDEERGPPRSPPSFPKPVTFEVPNWKPAKWPLAHTMSGRFARLEMLDPAKHGDKLWVSMNGPNADPATWDSVLQGPFKNRKSFDDYLSSHAGRDNYVLYAIIDGETGAAEGLIGTVYAEAEHGRLTLGHDTYGNGSWKSQKSTEAIYVLLKEAFSSGYRRVEWLSDNGKDRSKKALERLGFTLEAVYPQHRVVKGRNWDSAMYAIIDKEWPAIHVAYEKWLSLENLVANGQKASLEEYATR
ncbi:hypothetical protein AAVH_29941 [Aphelenchoides avenae]|nr:hypothetical protein AAVH_29941 [Aphelenchus avenae]